MYPLSTSGAGVSGVGIRLRPEGRNGGVGAPCGPLRRIRGRVLARSKCSEQRKDSCALFFRYLLAAARETSQISVVALAPDQHRHRQGRGRVGRNAAFQPWVQMSM